MNLFKQTNTFDMTNKNHYYPKKNQSGFSLVELLTTLVIATILMSYAIPSYRSFSLRQQVSNQVNNLVTDLTFAKVTAVKIAQQVVVQSKTAGDWSDGWWVYINANADKDRLDAGDILLRDEDASNGNIQLTASVTTGAGPNAITGGDFFVFDSLGSSPSGINSIDIEHSELTNTTSVNVSLSGVVTSVTTH